MRVRRGKEETGERKVFVFQMRWKVRGLMEKTKRDGGDGRLLSRQETGKWEKHNSNGPFLNFHLDSSSCGVNLSRMEEDGLKQLYFSGIFVLV